MNHDFIEIGSKDDIHANNIVGITGGIGSGKTTATNFLIEKGVPVVDADIVAREVVQPNTVGLDAIIQHFGSDILNQHKLLNREKLRTLIFEKPEEKKWLEHLLHPIIRQEICQQLTKYSQQHQYVVLSSPLLLETDQHTLVSTIIVIDVNRSNQIKRATQRDNNSKTQIGKIIDSQMSREKRCDKADIIINNDFSLSALIKQMDEVHFRLTNKHINLELS